MFLPSQLLEKALAWGPLVVGIVFLIGGTVLMRSPFLANLHVQVDELRKERAHFDSNRFATPHDDIGRALDETTAIESDQRKMGALKSAALLRKKLFEAKLQRRRTFAKMQDYGRGLGLYGSELRPAVYRGGIAGKTYAAVVHQRQRTRQFTQIKAGFVGKGGVVGEAGLFRMIDHGRLHLLSDNSSLWSLETGMRGAFFATELVAGIQIVALKPRSQWLTGLAGPLGYGALPYMRAASHGARSGLFHAEVASIRLHALGLGKMAGFSLEGTSEVGERAALQFQFHDFGLHMAVGPQLFDAGFARTSIRTRQIYQEALGAKWGLALSRPHVSYVSLAIKGLSDEVLRFGTFDLTDKTPSSDPMNVALPFSLKDLGGASATKVCSGQFYQALQLIRENNLNLLKETMSDLNKLDQSLSGRWIFKPAGFKAVRGCLRYKVYRSGRRKCVKRGIKSQALQTALLSDDEKKLYKSANAIIRSRGGNENFKKRSSNLWVMSQVRRNLATYMRQPSHPAICTGALRMVDYFENHLGRVKKVIEEHLLLMGSVNAALEVRRAYVEALLQRSAEAARISAEMRYIETKMAAVDLRSDHNDQSQSVLAPVSSSLAIPMLEAKRIKDAAGHVIRAFFGDGAADAVSRAPDELGALAAAKRVYETKNPRIDINRTTRLEMKRLFSLLEASYYLERRAKQYQGLSLQLFGTLGGIRKAHEIHCRCQ